MIHPEPAVAGSVHRGVAVDEARPDLASTDSLSTQAVVSSRDASAALADAVTAARVCDDFRGEDVVVLDLTGVTPEFDFFVIATGQSRRQMHAIIEEVDRRLGYTGHKRRSIEGYEESSWIVQDYGNLVLHVFTPETRELYELESLWGDAARVAWEAFPQDDSV